jgi:hypothetical protein
MQMLVRNIYYLFQFHRPNLETSFITINGFSEIFGKEQALLFGLLQTNSPFSKVSSNHFI